MNSVAKMVLGTRPKSPATTCPVRRRLGGFGWMALMALAAGPLRGAPLETSPKNQPPFVPYAATSVVLPPATAMTRAEVFFYLPQPAAQCRAVVVLCPGQNGNGERYVQEQPWQEFARRHGLALAALSFASPNELLEAGQGYFDASGGAGELLVQALTRAGLAGRPLFLHGFSGGAHFANTFVQWAPEKVSGWCAQAAASWKEPRKGATPPGIIACGEMDGARFGACLEHFQKGRRLGHPWTWVSLPGQGHRRSGDLEEFVRAYFAVLLEAKGSPLQADAVTKKPRAGAPAFPGLTVWLPDRALHESWAWLHRP